MGFRYLPSKGSYTERKWEPDNGIVFNTYRTIKENRFVKRKATDQHQVVVDRDLKESQKDKAATTLFFSGPTKREWGFIKEHKPIIAKMPNGNYAYGDTERIWVKWTTYLGLPDNTKSRG